MKFKIASSHCALNENRAALLEVSHLYDSSLSGADIVLECLVDTYLWWKRNYVFSSSHFFHCCYAFCNTVSQHNWILPFTSILCVYTSILEKISCKHWVSVPHYVADGRNPKQSKKFADESHDGKTLSKF